MKIGAAYIRVSTDMQLELSPESQLKAIRDYAQKNDIILSDEFIFRDEGISGRKAEKRPGFMRMIAVAKSKPKPFDVILIWKFSRFARNREDSIVYKSMLRKQCGIDVISISEQLGEDKTSILIEALLEAMDEYYSINLAEEVKRGMTEKARRGGVVAVPPFGYAAGKDCFVIDPERADTVRQIFDKFVHGEHTLVIAKWLNDIGVTTKNGKPFANRTVEYILSNPVYIGKIRWNTSGKATATSRYIATENTIIANGKHEPIIDEETFKKAQEIMTDIKKKYPKHSANSISAYMLRGLVHCDNCGAALTASAKGKGLQCYRYTHGQCKISHYVSLEKINFFVLAQLQANSLLEHFYVKSDSKVDNRKTENLKVCIKKERSKLERIKAAYENGIDTLEEYKENKQKVLAGIHNLENNLTICEDNAEKRTDIKNEVCDIYEISINPFIAEDIKNEILRAVIDKVVYYRSNGYAEIFYKI